MIKRPPSFRPFLLLSGLALLLATGSAHSQPSLLFSDDLENGTAAWTIFPGSPTCTAPQYVSTATDLFANHTDGGSHGFKLTNASDRVYHDISLTGFPTAGVHLSVWFYDVMDRRAYSFEPFDIRTQNSSQVLGLGAYYADPNYDVRILKNANGTSPDWLPTSIPRSQGWHHFELFQYRSPAADNVDFYIDGSLSYQAVGALDGTLNRVVLGLGWVYNTYQSGYVDDISVSAVPEPAFFSLAIVAVLISAGCRKKVAP